jgi:hypothetical protein
LDAFLEIRSGPLTGKRIGVPEGHPLTIGRTQRSDFAIPADTFLSSVHFSLECSGAVCRLTDRKSANGTFVNHSRVSEAVVRDGDEIAAGKTVFVLHITDSAPEALPAPVASPAPALPSELWKPQAQRTASSTPPPPALVIGSWRFSLVPEGWEAVEGYGLRRAVTGEAPSEAVVTEEELEAGTSLERYVEKQTDFVRQFVLEPEIQVVGPVQVPGSEEGTALSIQYKSEDGRRFAQQQIYVRAGQRVGTLTLTCPLGQLAGIRSTFESIRLNVRFEPSD